MVVPLTGLSLAAHCGAEQQRGMAVAPKPLSTRPEPFLG